MKKSRLLTALSITTTTAYATAAILALPACQQTYRSHAPSKTDTMRLDTGEEPLLPLTPLSPAELSEREAQLLILIGRGLVRS